jgi:hypothetical protein
MATPLSVSKVASNQLDVAITADELVSANSITATGLVDVVVAPFGENKFLVTLVYS